MGRKAMSSSAFLSLEKMKNEIDNGSESVLYGYASFITVIGWIWGLIVLIISLVEFSNGMFIPFILTLMTAILIIISCIITSAFIKVFANISLRLENIEYVQALQQNENGVKSIEQKQEEPKESEPEEPQKEVNWEEHSKYKAGQTVRWKKRNVNVIVKYRTSKGYICDYAATGQEVEEPIWEMYLTDL